MLAIETRALLTRIHAIVSHHLEQVARELLVAKANVNHQSNDGRTALMQAAQNGHEEVCSSCTFSVSIVVSKSRAHISTSALHTISIRSPGNCSRRNVTSITRTTRVGLH